MRFTDPETQELFQILLTAERACTNYLHTPEKEWDNNIEIELDRLFDKAHDMFISHVESRLRREQEPCEWEKESIPYFYREDMNFCPDCGRKLEEK